MTLAELAGETFGGTLRAGNFQLYRQSAATERARVEDDHPSYECAQPCGLYAAALDRALRLAAASRASASPKPHW